MERPRARWLALLAATIIAIYLCWLMLRPFVEVLLWGGVLAVVAQPLYRRLMERSGRPALAAAVTCFAVILTVVVPLSLVSLAIVKQANDALQRIPDSAKSFLHAVTHQAATQPATQPGDPAATVSPTEDPATPLRDSRLFRAIDPHFDLDRFLDPAYLSQRIQSVSAIIAGLVAQNLKDIVGGVLGTLVQIFFTLFTLFYLLRDGPVILRAMHDALPLEAHQADLIFVRTQEVISASVFGVLVIAALQGLLGGLIFMMLGLPSPVLWGFVMFLLSMIPMAGSAIVWLPAALFLLFTGHGVKATILIAFGAGVIGTIDNVLRPRLVGGKTRLHELVVFFSVLGGLQVFGVLGLFVGPVVVAITLALLDVFRQAEAARSAPQGASPQPSTSGASAAPAGEPLSPAAPMLTEEPSPESAPPVPQPAPRPPRRKKWRKR
jgi:predicted PurR-regulated permease PerM